ncbi:S46 family peptidase [candidate division KSB1 bacterium]|nr:S46 family peptidase [candidate division KSB1 bacterium]
MVKKILLSLLIISTIGQAEEGMWLLSQLDQLPLKNAGFELDADDIYHPEKPSISDAIVWLGGCTASFVSPDGLILTNHHCAYSAIQRASTPEKNFLAAGFLASNRSEEMEAIGMNAYCLKTIKDVTEEVLQDCDGLDDPVLYDKKITANITSIVDQIEGDREDVAAKITSNYEGKLYLLYIYNKYQDVRLVYAPPQDIGKFGGEIDNWMWPRHTGDFTFLRAYMAPDGSGQKFNEMNVPLKPKQYLKVAKQPIQEDDLTFILGFPGKTYRYRTSSPVDWNLTFGFPFRIKNYAEIIALLDSVTQNDKAGQLKVTSRRSSFSNSKKNAEGQLESMTKGKFLEKKLAFEAEFSAFLQENPELNDQYGMILSEIDAQYEDYKSDREKRSTLNLYRNASGVLPQIARDIVLTLKEREKPEEERNPDFTERSVEKKLKRLHLQYYNYYPATDKALLTAFLKKVLRLPGNQRVDGLSSILPKGEKSIASFIETAFEKSQLKDVEYAKSLYTKKSIEVEALGEPLIQLALTLYPELDLMDERTDDFSARIMELRKHYMSALLAWKGTEFYPDANSSMRFTYGHIAGYSPADGILYTPFTTLSGVVDKHTGEWPFNVPEKLSEAYNEKDFGKWLDVDNNDISVNFLHRCDITGGNSGSPVMNARGELIGLAFDGNWEALTGDWQYDYDIQRTISVDIRYVLFIVDKVAESSYILNEMKL